MGLLQIDRGEIRIKGKETRGQSVAEMAREVAYLPQNPNDLLFAETVVEEFQITLRNHGLNGQIDAEAAIAELGLGALRHVYPRDLSTGQRQRVALGAVTIAQPALILLDEPTRGLDVQNKQGLARIWRHWLAQGIGLILVTHDVELAATVADRVAILSQGEVIASGPTSEILGSSPLFAPQIARLFPGSGWLTAQEALDQLVPLTGQ
jgi:energy-coupling factor transport system ATP-binding protein